MSLVTGLIKKEYSDLYDFKVDQNVQTSKELLKFMGHIKHKIEFMEFENNAMPNIFLPNADNENFDNRKNLIKSLLLEFEKDKYIPESKIQFEVSHIMDPLMLSFNYTDDYAEENYLNTRPMSFLIISKPNVGEVELAKLISEIYKCVLITPESLIFEEISSDTRAGKCIHFNLKNGRAIPAEVFLNLLERRIKSLTAQHRGYVVAGFPLIPNSNFKEDPISSESAIFNVQEIFEEITNISVRESVSTMKGSKISMEEEEILEEEQEIVLPQAKRRVVTPNYGRKKSKFPMKDLGKEILNSFGHFDAQATIENQLNYIFSEIFNEQPYIFIYITIENLDVVNKISNYRFNLVAEQEVTTFPQDGLPDFSPDKLNDEIYIVEPIDYKTNVKLPIHFEKSLSEQLKEFKYKILPTVNSEALKHDIQYFIKIDGRLTPYKMFKSIYPRLRSLGVQPALVPQLLNEDEMDGEFMDEQKPVFGSLEEAFDKLRLKNIPNRMYKLQLSHWGYRCPVAFKNRIIKYGKAENAVRFMNKIFFLGDENAVQLFYRNPRPYLVPIKPKPVYKIIVMGSLLSGRSVIARALSNMFNLAYINPKEIEDEYMQEKNQVYLDSVRSAAIVEGIQRITEFRIKDREEKINFWLTNILGILKIEYPDLVVHSSETVAKQSSQELLSQISLQSEMSAQTKSDLNNELKQFNIPVDDHEEIRKLLENPENLLDYLPDELKKPVKPPNIYDQMVSDYIEEAVRNVVYPTYELSTGEIYDMIQQAITSFDHEYFEKTGWVIDGFNPDIETFNYFTSLELPNEIIYIDEKNNEKPILKDRYENQTFNSTKEIYDYLKWKSDSKLAIDKVEDQLDVLGTYTMSSMIVSDSSVYEIYPKVEPYLEAARDFTNKWLTFRSVLLEKCPNPPIELELSSSQDENTSKPMSEIFTEIRRILRLRYRQQATYFSDAEKFEEQNDFGGNIPLEEGAEGVEENLFEDNRRLGDTAKYCPVAFGKYFALWKGKDSYSSKFQEKIYLMSSESALNDFLSNPYKYTFDAPPRIIPPMRVIVLGPIGTGKTTYGQFLSRHFGLFHFDFDKQLLNFLNLDSTMNLYEFLDQTEPKDIEIVKNYLTEAKLPQYILDSLIKVLWTEAPFKETGFVLENFPKTKSDIDYLLKNYFIPDIVIEVTCDLNDVKERNLSKKLDRWTLNQEIEKENYKKEFKEKLVQWEKEYKLRVDVLVDVTEDQRREQFYHSITPNPPQVSPIDSSTTLNDENENEEVLDEEVQEFVYDDQQRKEDLVMIKKRVLEDYPKPIDNKVWENYDEAYMRFDDMINKSFNQNEEELKKLRSTFTEENIDHRVYVNSEPIEKLALRLIKDLEVYKFRNRSIFERIYSVTVETAERLLEQGYYFLSKFGKTCPVQVYEKKNPLQMYLVNENQMTLFPVIHRRNIYFLCGDNALKQFKNDPLKFIENFDYKFPLIPFKMAVIGPERTGKTKLAERIERVFGLQLITRGQAIRYVMKNLRYSELAKNMKKVLDKGWSLTEEMTANAVQAAILAPKCIAQGYMLVGFPSSEKEMRYLEDLDILPHMFFELLKICPYVDRSCVEIVQGKLTIYSYEFITHRYELFKEANTKLKNYIQQKYQNFVEINEENKWTIYERCKNEIFQRHLEVINYIKYKDLCKALPLRYLLITPEEFWMKKNKDFLNYCPCCLYYNNHLVDGGAIDHNGLIQFRQHYFWVCKEHFDKFLKKPHTYLPPNNENLLPESLPAPINEPVYNYYEDGLCFICFYNNKKLVHGDDDFKIRYMKRIYIFCSLDHKNIFLKEPHSYADLNINFRNDKPLFMKELPTIGFLEQTTASLLSEIIMEIERIRPVHPCMSIEKSALIYMAILLKYRNPNMKNDFKVFYKNALDKYKQRCKEIKKFIKLSKIVR